MNSVPLILVVYIFIYVSVYLNQDLFPTKKLSAEKPVCGMP